MILLTGNVPGPPPEDPSKEAAAVERLLTEANERKQLMQRNLSYLQMPGIKLLRYDLQFRVFDGDAADKEGLMISGLVLGGKFVIIAAEEDSEDDHLAAIHEEVQAQVVPGATWSIDFCNLSTDGAYQSAEPWAWRPTSRVVSVAAEAILEAIYEPINPAEDMVTHMALTIWASAWADFMEEYNPSAIPPGSEIFEICPEPSVRSHEEANILLGRYLELNGLHSVEHLLNRITEVETEGKSVSDELMERLAKDAGYCLVMMSSGSGVHWEDDHAELTIEVPQLISYDFLSLIDQGDPRYEGYIAMCGE